MYDNNTINGYELPRHLSHSSLTTFLQCGHKYYLSRVVQEKEQPAWWFVGGNAVHTATEKYDRQYPDTPCPKPDTNFFLDAFAEETAWQEFVTGVDPSGWRAGGRVSREWPDRESSDWWVANGPGMVESWVDWRNSSGWSLFELSGVPSVEVGLDFELDGFGLKMFLDRLMVNQAGELIVVDLKSGKSSPRSALQLALYAYGCERVLGVRPKWGTFWKARDGVTTPLVDLDSWSADRVEYIVSGFDKLRKSGIFLPNLDECSGCGFVGKCEWSAL